MISFGKIRFLTAPLQIRKAFDSPRTDAVLYSKAVQIKGMAILIFESRVKHTHPVTLPAYVSSFRINRVRGLLSNKFRVENTDPAAFWVEFGAYLHVDGHATILRYKPLTRAIDAIGLEG